MGWWTGPIFIERWDTKWIFNLIFFMHSYLKCRAWGEGCIQATRSDVTFLKIWKDTFHFENLKPIQLEYTLCDYLKFCLLSWACLSCPLCPYLDFRPVLNQVGIQHAILQYDIIIIWCYCLLNRFRFRCDLIIISLDDLIWCALMRFDMIWCDIIWCEMIWYDMIWDDIIWDEMMCIEWFSIWCGICNCCPHLGWIIVENCFCILWISEMVLKMKSLQPVRVYALWGCFFTLCLWDQPCLKLATVVPTVYTFIVWFGPGVETRYQGNQEKVAHR